MPAPNVKYQVRPLLGTTDYVICASWPDGQEKQLIGVYISEIAAERVAGQFRKSSPPEIRSHPIVVFQSNNVSAKQSKRPANI
ncbi:hypothetical protein [Tardiphaga sp.]|uniref:hypothetical protein n=1 Tax=Tardiphaga sp. TaxID=1926292 RepID=UPI0037DA5AD8